MAKEQLSRTKACAAKTLYAGMPEMKRHGGSIEANVELTEWEKEPADKMKYVRWSNSFQFYSIDYVKAVCGDDALVSTTIDAKFGRTQVEVEPGLYVIKHSNNRIKKQYHDQISKTFNLGWRVEIVE